jgi:hypothetical protein
MAFTPVSAASIRRGQLIVPFGVGALITNRHGTSIICGCLDRWFRSDKVDDLSEFIRTEDWRLLKRLGLQEVRLPPDHREGGPGPDEEKNVGLTVPGYRFPRWHVCPFCRRMREVPLTARRVRCNHCEPGGWRNKAPEMYQVRFVAACDHGHLQDFPWREWVHRDSSPDCEGTLRLFASGGGSLASVRVKCEECDASENLFGVTRTSEDGKNTFLSENLDPKGGAYLCRGKKPWTGSVEGKGCSRPLRATLRNASNLYFAETVSSIYLPRGQDDDLDELVNTLKSDAFSFARTMLRGITEREEHLEQLQKNYPSQLDDYTTDQLDRAFQIVFDETEEEEGGGSGTGKDNGRGVSPEDGEGVRGDTEEVRYRRAEYSALQKTREGSRLTIHRERPDLYGDAVSRFFSGVWLVERLQETRVLAGFTRLSPGNDADLSPLERRRLLWKDRPESWLPASIVRGEGIFLRLDEERLSDWESRTDVQSRVAPLQSRYERSRHYTPGREITPRFVLVHTLSHLLINQLVFECGYSTAALRERLYVSADAENPMAGILIYTAAGDSDGTMGGLVRMGKPGEIEPVLRTAIHESEWCSADPICMEAGQEGGQGPESLNLAACHNCALTPETSCEEFNRFLDRGLLIGFGNARSENGYFASLAGAVRETSDAGAQKKE